MLKKILFIFLITLICNAQEVPDNEIGGETHLSKIEIPLNIMQQEETLHRELRQPL